MNSILRYKGYSARPEYSADDQVFYGKILGIDDLVDFYTENAKEIEKEFRAAVDDYLEFCEEVGKQPQKAFSGTFMSAFRQSCTGRRHRKHRRSEPR